MILPLCPQEFTIPVEKQSYAGARKILADSRVLNFHNETDGKNSRWKIAPSNAPAANPG